MFFKTKGEKIMNSLFKNSTSNNKNMETIKKRFNTVSDDKYTQLKKEGKILGAADLIQQKPIEFLQELEPLLSSSTSKNIAFGVVDRFSEVVDLLPEEKLVETKTYFEGKRNSGLFNESALRELINVLDSELDIILA